MEMETDTSSRRRGGAEARSNLFIFSARNSCFQREGREGAEENTENISQRVYLRVFLRALCDSAVSPYRRMAGMAARW